MARRVVRLFAGFGTTALLLGAIAAGSSIGIAAPELGERLSAYIDHTVIVLVSLLFFEVSIRRFRLTRGDARFLAIAWVANFLIIPFIGFGLASSFLPGQAIFATGLTIYFMAPCTDWFLGFTRLAGGNTSLGAALLPVNMVSQLVLYPVYLALFTRWTPGIEIGTSVDTLVEWFVVPVLLSLAARAAIGLLGRGGTIARAQGVAGNLIPWVIAALIVEIFAVYAPVIRDHVSGFARVLAAVFAFFVATYLLGEAAARLFRLEYPEHVLLAMTTAARNAPLMLGITVAAIPDQPLLYAALIIGMLVEFPHLTLLKVLLVRKRAGRSSVINARVSPAPAD